jgi:predicted PurR-regulated permease PerM
MATDRSSWQPPVVLARWAAIAGCALVIGAGLVATALLLGRLSLVLLPVIVATLLTRALIVPATALERRGWRPAPRAAVTLLGFLAIVAALVAFIAPPLAEELSDLGPTLEDGLAQVEDWIVEDSPVDIDRQELEDLEEQAVESVRGAASGSADQVVAGAQRALEVIAGLLLALILTFFALKDGPALQQWATDRLPERRREQARTQTAAGWAALGGYLRAAALLGVLEGVVIGVALFLVGGSLVLPIVLLTFAAAFIPIVGATLAGIAAVLVALVTAGTPEALIVAVVAIVVQQLDNDLLAPWIYGRALQLHPAAILLAITTGTALFGFPGTILAVPVTAVVVSALNATARADEDQGSDASAVDPSADGAAEPA